MIIAKDFYFIRHGETDWNRERRGMGQKNIPLNEKGIDQARSAALVLEKIHPPIIFHSPLSRAKDTAEIIAEKTRSRLVVVPDLIECSWGEREGDPKGPWLEEWIAGAKIKGAELYSEFILRALRGVNQCLSESQQDPLIVAHGGVFWAIQQFAGLGEHSEIRNAAPMYLKAPQSKNELDTALTRNLWKCTALA